MTREITITPVLNGFVVQVGCQRVVFDSVKDMTSQIKRYYKNPDQIEKEFVEHALNKTLQNVPQPVNCTSPCDPCVGSAVERR